MRFTKRLRKYNFTYTNCNKKELLPELFEIHNSKNICLMYYKLLGIAVRFVVGN